MLSTSPNASPHCSTATGRLKTAMTTADPDPATTGRRAGGAAAADAAPAHPPRRPRGPGHREGAALGPRRGPAGAAHRGGRRPGPLLAGHPPGPRRRSRPARPSTPGTRHLSSIPAPTQAALRTLEWIGRHENLVVCGPSGTGKTFLLEALGQAAVEAGKHVAWFTLEPSASWSAATAPTTPSPRPSPGSCAPTWSSSTTSGCSRRPRRRRRPLPPRRRRLRETQSSRSARTCTRPGSTSSMPKTLATATVDRLLHHAHVCQTSGDSIRLSQALAGKGVMPPDLTPSTAGGHPPGRSGGHHRSILLSATVQDLASATVQVGVSLDTGSPARRERIGVPLHLQGAAAPATWIRGTQALIDVRAPAAAARRVAADRQPATLRGERGVRPETRIGDAAMRVALSAHRPQQLPVALAGDERISTLLPPGREAFFSILRSLITADELLPHPVGQPGSVIAAADGQLDGLPHVPEADNPSDFAHVGVLAEGPPGARTPDVTRDQARGGVPSRVCWSTSCWRWSGQARCGPRRACGSCGSSSAVWCSGSAASRRRSARRG